MSLTFAQRGRPPPSPAQIQKVYLSLSMAFWWRHHLFNSPYRQSQSFQCYQFISVIGWELSTYSDYSGLPVERQDPRMSSVSIICYKLERFWSLKTIAILILSLRVEQILHRNLVYLASVADPTQNVQQMLPVLFIFCFFYVAKF
jgi:hypothetical protein